MIKLFVLIALLLIVSLKAEDKIRILPQDVYAPSGTFFVNNKLDNEISIWATYYKVHKYNQSKNGIDLRDMKNKKLGIKLSRRDFCSLAMNGTGSVNGRTIHYAGTKKGFYTRCNYSPSSYSRFHIMKYRYGVGNRYNPLKPFVSIACDQKKYKYGQRFYIPEAKGILLPNNRIHTGYFICEDVGGLIRENHIDIFLGDSDTNPFYFLSSNKDHKIKAYLVE